MYSVLPKEQTASLVFFNICLLLIMHMLMRKSLRQPYVVSASCRRLSVFLMFIFVLFSFWGSDWFHYKEIYECFLGEGGGHMEEVYFWIAQNLSIDYLSFRLIVWGGGLILFFFIIEGMPIKKDLALLIFSSIWIIWYSYARKTIPHIMYWSYPHWKFCTIFIAESAHYSIIIGLGNLPKV